MAPIVLTEGAKGMGAVRKPKACRRTVQLHPGQFDNPPIPKSTERPPDPRYARTPTWSHFVSGIGTGAYHGSRRILKIRKPDIRVVAVEPTAGPLKGYRGGPQDQGIGAGLFRRC